MTYLQGDGLCRPTDMSVASGFACAGSGLKQFLDAERTRFFVRRIDMADLKQLMATLRVYQNKVDDAQTDWQHWLDTNPAEAAKIVALIPEEEAACEALAAEVENRDLDYSKRVVADRLLAQLRILGHRSFAQALYAVKQATSAAIASAVLAVIIQMLMLMA